MEMAFTKQEVRTYFGQCKCCLNYAYLKNMWKKESIEGEGVYFGKMLIDCFSISWTSNNESDDDKICDMCIMRLRDAFNFKKQVLQSLQDSMQNCGADDANDDKSNDLDCEDSDVDQKTYEDVQYLEKEVLDEDKNNGERSLADDANDDKRNDFDCEDSDVDQKTYEDVQYLEEEVLDEDSADGESSLDSQPKIKKRKWPKRLPKSERHKTYRQYTDKQLQIALEAVKSNNMTILQAAEMYGVPRQTLKAKTQDTNYENERQNKMNQFIKEIKAILKNTNATPFKAKSYNYYCIFCSVAIKNPTELRAHTHSTHTDKVTRVEFVMRPHYYYEMLKLDVLDLKCCCNKEGNWLDMLTHLETEHGVQLEESRTRIIPYTLKDNEMPCAMCDFTSSFISIDKHMNAHFQNHVCGECGVIFATVARLNSHWKSHRIGAFPCDECEKVFSREPYRKKHKDVVHKKKLIYKCLHCDERFHSDVVKHRHMEKEHGDKLESKTCEECNKTFTFGPGFTQHVRSHRRQLERRRLKS